MFIFSFGTETYKTQTQLYKPVRYYLEMLFIFNMKIEMYGAAEEELID